MAPAAIPLADLRGRGLADKVVQLKIATKRRPEGAKGNNRWGGRATGRCTHRSISDRYNQFHHRMIVQRSCGTSVTASRSGLWRDALRVFRFRRGRVVESVQDSSSLVFYYRQIRGIDAASAWR